MKQGYAVLLRLRFAAAVSEVSFTVDCLPTILRVKLHFQYLKTEFLVALII